VSGESAFQMPLGNREGGTRETINREPGDLPLIGLTGCGGQRDR